MERFVCMLFSLGVLAVGTFGIVAAETCSLDNHVTWLASCANVALFLNDTINSQPEICRIYSESLYCMQHNARAHGLVCSDSDIVHATRIILGQSARANFDNCNVTQEQGTICSPDRLGPFALVTCRILLAQQVEFGAKNCMLSQYFLKCVNNQLKFAGAACSAMEVQMAMDSQTSVDWLHRNYPSLNMSKCFYTSSEGGRNECADPLSVLSANKPALRCVGTISALGILKDDTITDAELCGVHQELVYCVEREVLAGGYTCTSDQVSNMVNSYYSIALGSSSNKTILGNCHDNTSTLTTSICSDAERLSNYVAVFSHAYLVYLQHPLTSDFCKTFTDSIKDNLAVLNDNCTTSAIFTALTSPIGRTRLSRYTIEDLTPCLSIGQ